MGASRSVEWFDYLATNGASYNYKGLDLGFSLVKRQIYSTLYAVYLYCSCFDKAWHQVRFHDLFWTAAPSETKDETSFRPARKVVIPTRPPVNFQP